MKVRDDEKMEESSSDEIFKKRDFRKKNKKKREHRVTTEKEESIKESFKKMKDEIDELRKKELERTKELDELKKKIEKNESDKNKPEKEKEKEIEYALDFDRETYLSKGFIESAQWIKNVLAKNMNEKMNSDDNKKKFEAMRINRRQSRHLGIRACARYNRGEECSLGKWHATHNMDGIWTNHGSRHRAFREYPDGQQRQHDEPGDARLTTSTRRNELRLHVCTLCLEALGSANGHSVLDCPWIMKKNWFIESGL